MVEYEKIATFDPKGSDRRFISPKYHYGLAKLYEQRGLHEKAIQQYEIFLTLWKDAKLRLMKLKGKAAR